MSNGERISLKIIVKHTTVQPKFPILSLSLISELRIKPVKDDEDIDWI